MSVAVHIRHSVNQRVLYALLHDPAGGVARDMLRRGIRVQSQAKRNLAGGNGRPRRIDTGALRADIHVTPAIVDRLPAARVGVRKRYGPWVHDGTGIYGPRRQPIVPKHGKVLVFPSRSHGRRRGKFAGKVVVRSVKGMRPNPFLADALKAARY